jgi:hypothetical protein
MASAKAYPAAPPYSLPDPLDTMEEASRYHHDDLESMPGELLWDEEEAVTTALHGAIRGRRTILLWALDGFSVTARDWLQDRLTRVHREIERRPRDDR